ncbi:hypothetical protein D3C85_1335690 [compost metagenome]
MQVDGDIPDAGGQRVHIENVVQQQQMRDELRQMRGSRNGVMCHPGARERSPGNRHEDGGGKRHHQLLVTTPDRPQRIRGGQEAARRQAARGQEAADDKKDLHGNARIVGQPADQPRGEGLRGIGHRPVEGQMVQHDQL